MIEKLSQDSIVDALAARAARLPRRARARRHRRVQLRRHGADPRHPDRDRDEQTPPREAYPEGRVGRGGRELSGYAFDPCAKCEEMMQPYLDRDLDRRADARGGGASRRVLVLPQPLPLRGLSAPLRPHRGAEQMPLELKAKLVGAAHAASVGGSRRRRAASGPRTARARRRARARLRRGHRPMRSERAGRGASG